MRTSIFFVVSALGMFAAWGAAAEDSPPAPPDTANPPAAPPAPPPEPAPPPSTPPTAPPPSETPPSPPPAKPKEVAPANVTLEDEPEEPLPLKPSPSGAPATKRPKHKPKKESSPPPPETTAPESTVERHPEASPETKPSEGDEGEGKSEEKSKDKSKKDENDGEGLLGPFRIGILVGTGLPSILSFGAMIKLTRYFGAGVNIGIIPAIRLSYYGEADLSYQEYDLYGRLFPFGGAIFVGAGVGYASVAGSFKGTVDTPPVSQLPPNIMLPPNLVLPPSFSVASEASVRTLVLTPMIGLLHTFGSGFTIGVDLGAQIPIAPSESHVQTVVVPTPPPQVIDTKQNDQKVQDTLDTMSRTILPTLNLRIGWLI
jgi:hypothetical protein